MQLGRDDVLRGALDLLDEDGLDRLTMRRLAKRLDVQHGGLYWHFANKQALLDAIAERLLDGVADIDTSLSAVDQLAELASRLRRALLSHRDGARVVSGTYVRQPNTLYFGNVAVRAAIAAGVPIEQAGLVVFTIQDYVLGHTIEEQAREQLIAAGEWDDRRTPIDPDRYPELGIALDHLVHHTTAEQRFRHGLDLILAGIGCQPRLRVGRGRVG